MRKTVLIISGNFQYRELFMRAGFNVISDISEAIPDLICFTGGEDVSPSMYGEPAHLRTYHNFFRDQKEQRIFKDAIELDIPMVGICRGGQFLNVMNGGKMFQHVTKHTQHHPLLDLETGQVLTVTSTHHQMMREGETAKIVATARQGGTKESVAPDGTTIVHLKETPDIEVLYYPNTRCLCFQPHPEFYGEDELQTYFFSLVTKYLF